MVERLTSKQIIHDARTGKDIEQHYIFGHKWGPAYFKRGSEDYDEYSKLLDRLAAYEDLGPVEELAALKERTRWIPCSERLPETDGFYNVVMNGDRWGEPDVWSATSCGFYDGVWDEDGTTITHWMLLPEAPKEEAHHGH